MSDDQTKGRTALELAQLKGRGEFGGAIAQREQKLTPAKGRTALELAQRNGRGEFGGAIARRDQKPKPKGHQP
jgi:hypothetical protein